MSFQRASRVIAALAVVVVTSGCAALGGSGSGTPIEPTEPQWDCYWEPTINDDWHDDIFCTDGVDSERPILLRESDFVTEEEMVAAGEAYEAELNAAE